MSSPDLLRATATSDISGLVKVFMKGDVDVNMIDKEGRTALHIACMNNNLALIKYLLHRKDIDLQIRDKNGKLASQLIPKGPDRANTMMYFSKAEARRLRRERKVNVTGEQENEDMLEETDLTEADIVSPAAMRKLIICVIVPFLYLIFANGLFFAVRFIVVSLVFYYIVLAYFVAEVAIRPPWYHFFHQAKTLIMKLNPDYWQGWINDPKTDFNLDYEDVSFQSADKLTLRGWYVPPPANGPKRDMGVVLVHGAGRDRRAWLRHIPFLHKAGYGCLLFDLREHGLSDGNGRGTTFGMKERFDVVAACDCLRENYDYARVCAMGTSVGGGSVIMAAAIDPTIDCVISENPMTTAATLLDQQIVMTIGGYFSQARYSKFIFKLFRKCSTFWMNWRIGNKPSKHCQSLHVIDTISPRPILLMHGTVDTIVFPKHSQVLFDAAKEPKELYMCENAFHCGLYNTSPDEYEQRVLTFLERCPSDVPAEKKND